MSLHLSNAKGNYKCMKGYDEIKKSSYIQYWDVNKLCGWAMSQKLPINNFEWTIDTSQLNEDFIINYYDESDEGYFLKLVFNILKNYLKFIMIYHFYLIE